MSSPRAALRLDPAAVKKNSSPSHCIWIATVKSEAVLLAVILTDGAPPTSTTAVTTTSVEVGRVVVSTMRSGSTASFGAGMLAGHGSVRRRGLSAATAWADTPHFTVTKSPAPWGVSQRRARSSGRVG